MVMVTVHGWSRMYSIDIDLCKDRQQHMYIPLHSLWEEGLTNSNLDVCSIVHIHLICINY